MSEASLPVYTDRGGVLVPRARRPRWSPDDALGKLPRSLRRVARTTGAMWVPPSGRKFSPLSRSEAEWHVVSGLVRQGATDGEIVDFLQAFPIGERMRQEALDPEKWVSAMRQRVKHPGRGVRLEGRQVEVRAALDGMWLTLEGSWSALVGWLAVAAKAEAACTLVGVTCSQREVTAATGTAGSTVWGALLALPCVTVTASPTKRFGTEFQLTSTGLGSAARPGRPSRDFVGRHLRHDAVLGRALTGRLLLTWAAVACGASSVDDVAVAWCIPARRAQEWVAATARTGVIVTDGGTLTLGCSLDELAERAGVVGAGAQLAARHEEERAAHRAALARAEARRAAERQARCAEPAAVVTGEPHWGPAPELGDGEVAAAFYDAVDALNVGRRAVARAASALMPRLLTRYGGDLDLAVEAARAAGAAVSSWAWAREAIDPADVTSSATVLAVAKRAADRLFAGMALESVVPRAAAEGARLKHARPERYPSLHERQAARTARAIAREQHEPAPAPVAPRHPRWTQPSYWPSYTVFSVAVAVRYGLAPLRTYLVSTGTITETAARDLIESAAINAATIATSEWADGDWDTGRVARTEEVGRVALELVRAAVRGAVLIPNLFNNVYTETVKANGHTGVGEPVTREAEAA